MLIMASHCAKVQKHEHGKIGLPFFDGLCQSINLLFMILGIYNFGHNPKSTEHFSEESSVMSRIQSSSRLVDNAVCPI